MNALKLLAGSVFLIHCSISTGNDNIANISAGLNINVNECQPYQKANAWKDVMLGASYLLNPEFAKTTKVLWTYPAMNKEFLRSIADESIKVDYLYLKDIKSSMVKFMPMPLVEAGAMAETIDDGSEWAKILSSVAAAVDGYEIGVATDSPMFGDIASKEKYMSWGNTKGIEQSSKLAGSYMWPALDSENTQNIEQIKARAMSYGIAASVNRCIGEPVLPAGPILPIERSPE